MGEEYYQLVGRCTTGVRVQAYVLRNVCDGNVHVLDKELVYSLAMRKRIVNCTAQKYDGKVVFKGIKFKITDLPNYNTDGTLRQRIKKEEPQGNISIKSRIVEGKNTIGYIVSRVESDGTTKNARVPRDKVIELARSGRISNARVQRLNDKFLLRGVSCELSQLPVVRV